MLKHTTHQKSLLCLSYADVSAATPNLVRLIILLLSTSLRLLMLWKISRLKIKETKIERRLFFLTNKWSCWSSCLRAGGVAFVSVSLNINKTSSMAQPDKTRAHKHKAWSVFSLWQMRSDCFAPRFWPSLFIVDKAGHRRRRKRPRSDVQVLRKDRQDGRLWEVLRRRVARVLKQWNDSDAHGESFWAWTGHLAVSYISQLEQRKREKDTMFFSFHLNQ